MEAKENENTFLKILKNSQQCRKNSAEELRKDIKSKTHGKWLRVLRTAFEKVEEELFEALR